MDISDDRERVRRLLLESKRIAVVGCSPKPHRPSHQIAAYLVDQGYDVVPVNPGHDEILGLECFPDLAAVPGKIDIVDVFRNERYTPEVATRAVAAKAEALWLQSGIVNDEAARIAEEGGLAFVMDRCIMVLHRMLVRT